MKFWKGLACGFHRLPAFSPSLSSWNEVSKLLKEEVVCFIASAGMVTVDAESSLYPSIPFAFFSCVAYLSATFASAIPPVFIPPCSALGSACSACSCIRTLCLILRWDVHLISYSCHTLPWQGGDRGGGIVVMALKIQHKVIFSQQWQTKSQLIMLFAV